ncbi:hypothetical protein JB92DRAFT_2921677 [Gautieria morchelliformis]|nr:hypothetical protein JB92DRAFT_2921677 [Gautieria morchelliformis]
MSATTLWAWEWTWTARGWTQGMPPTSSSHDTVEAEEPRLVRREDSEVCRVEGGIEEVREATLGLVERGGDVVWKREAPYVSCHTVQIRVLVVLVVPLHRVVGLHRFISLYRIVALHVIASFNRIVTLYPFSPSIASSPPSPLSPGSEAACTPGRNSGRWWQNMKRISPTKWFQCCAYAEIRECVALSVSNPHHWVNKDRVWMQMQIEN